MGELYGRLQHKVCYLKYPRNIFGICSNYVSLCDRSDVEHLTATKNQLISARVETNITPI